MRALQSRGPARAPEAGPAVKGTLVVTVLKFLRSKGLDPATVIAQLPPADREVLQGVVLPCSWYSAVTFARFVEAAAAAVREEHRDACVMEMGRFSAQTNMGPGGVRRAYIREGDPHHALAAISRIYPTVYSTGNRTYQRTGERSATVRGHGTRIAHDQCAWVAGWLQRVVELSGGRDVRVVEAQCQASGAPHCEYHIDWGDPHP